MFLSKKSLAIAALTTASLACTAYAPAQTVSFNSAGSSAQWQTFALAASLLANKPGYTVHHYTIKGKAADGSPYAGIADSRTSGGVTPPVEAGNLWVVWNEVGSNGTPVNVWAFSSVDSVVGLRTFFAVPRAKLVLDPSITTTKSAQLISATLPDWATEDAFLPQSVYNVLNDLPLTAANTDIRPEDGLFAYNRIVATLNPTTRAGLGYGPGPIGTGIQSHYSTTVATPVAFSLTGADPISGEAHPSGGYTTIPVGATPIVFVVNKTNASGLGKPGLGHDLSVTEAAGNVAYTIFGGKSCIFNGVTVNPVLREPLSGTMNTAEFTNFRLTASPSGSQEANINPTLANNNPLNLTCLNGAGVRTRAVGTGESINNGVLPTADAIGYAFWGFGNFSKLAASTSYGYLTLDGVDPIAASYTNGELPACPASGCPVAGGTSFPNLRNGTYRSWSLLRVVTDSATTNPTNYNNTVALVAAANKLINKTVPDFVPFLASCATTGANEPGLDVYREHFTPTGITVTPNDGSVPTTVDCSAHSGAPAQTLVGRTLGGGTEAGGDVGGKIQGPFTANPPTPGPTGTRQ